MSGIPLARMLADLRGELIEAQRLGSGQDLKFQIEDIELELRMTTSQQGDDTTKVDFKVFNAAKGNQHGSSAGHTIKLTMRAVGGDGRSFEVNSAPTKRPE